MIPGRPTRVLAAALFAASLSVTASATDCETWRSSDPEVVTPPTGVSLVGTYGDGEGGDGTYYVDNDICNIGCTFSVWIYEETNAIAGLQRGDEFVDDTCHGSIESDSIIF